MEDIKIYGHLISGISDDNSSYSNGDNWIAEAHDIYDEGFKNLSEEIVEGSLPIERQDQINRYLYNKEVNSTANLTEALSQETTARENNDALLSADISAIDGRLQSQINDIQNKLNNYKLYSIVTTLPTSNIDKNKIYIIASEEGVENNIYTEYIYTENNTWEKLGEFKADIDLTPYVKKTQLADDTRNGLMSADDKIKLDNITNDSLLPNTDDVAGGVSILTAGKTSHAGSTQTSIEWSKLSVERNGYEMNIRGGNASDNTIITLPPATDNQAGLLPAYLYTPLNNKQAIISNLKLSNDTNITTSDYIVLTRADYQAILDKLATNHEAIKETEPIVITLAYTDSESEENSFDYTQQDPEESRILTEEEIQKSNLAALRNIENLNRPIVIKINDKSYYPTCKTMTEYTGERFIYIEIGELESNYITLISYESVSKGNSSLEDVVIRSRKIHHLVSNFNSPNEASRDYGLIMEGDFWSMWNRLIALEEQVFGEQKP